MQRRTARAVSRTRDASEVIVATLTRAQAVVLSRARSRLRMLIDKQLDERNDEADANAHLLDAVAALRDVRQLPVLVVTDVDSLPLAFMLRDDGASSLLTCACDVSIDIASSWAVVYRDGVDATVSEVCGPGTFGFVRHDSARNSIALVPRMPSGTVAEYVAVDDVTVAAVGGSAAVSVGESGSFECLYTVDDSVREVDIRISVCGVLVWACVVRAREVTGRHLQSYGVAPGQNLGLAVSPDSRYMAVSFRPLSSYLSELCVYFLEAGGISTQLHTVTSWGERRNHGQHLRKMCFTPTGNLLVCDYDRVHELTGIGEADPEHLRFILADSPMSIAATVDMLAVSLADCEIQILSYATGALIRSIVTSGTGLGIFGGSCSGVCFTPDGQCIVAADSDDPVMSMFRVVDGSFVKNIGVGVLADGPSDVVAAPNGDLLVADTENHRVCVFNAAGDTLLRCWGTQGEDNGQFNGIVAVALVDCKLFVLDHRSRVQVFE
jgi:hypothetical protein